MRKLDSKESALVDRLNNVLLNDAPTTEELMITLEITPEDIIERFPDRVYDLREKIVDQHIIFGEDDDPEDCEECINYDDEDTDEEEQV